MSAETMRAVRFHDYGPADNLVVEEVPRPVPGEGQVLVEVRAVGVHPFDCKVRQGLLREVMPLALPHIPGVDFAGVVAAVGPDVKGFAVGDEVYGGAAATYAEFAIAPVMTIARKPASLSLVEAAAVPLGAATAVTALTAARLEAGQTVLVQGAAGGVGQYVVQLARQQGVTVIATASGANADLLDELGAAQVIDYRTTRPEDAVRDVDAVIDLVGGDVLERSMELVRKGGTLVTLAGQPSQERAAELGIEATTLYAQIDAALLDRVGRLIDAGELRVAVADVLPLAQAAQAHARSEAGHSRGRLVLAISE